MNIGCSPKTLCLWGHYLEHLQRCSICDRAQKNWMKKIQRLPVRLKKMVLAQQNCAGCRAWYQVQQWCAPAKYSVLNMIYLLLSVSDWPITMIGPGGLLLVVTHLFAVPVSVPCVGLQKSTWLNLDPKNIFAGSHTEPRWRCSYPGRAGLPRPLVRNPIMCLDFSFEVFFYEHVL